MTSNLAGAPDIRVILAGALLLALAVVLAYRLMSRDPSVRRTRYGVFVERERYTDPDGPPTPEEEEP